MNEDLFPLLESYLEGLHAGRPPAREPLVRAHPELAGMLECLDDLQRLSPAAITAETRDFVPPTLGTPPVPCESLSVASGTTAGEFSRYELLEELGRGGMGVVYKARQKDLDRLVAVKMILSGALSSAEQQRRFVSEARMAAQLQHPNIVRIFDSGELHGQPYFVMEYVSGPSLADLLGNGPAPVEAAVRFVATIARAVEHLHVHHIVHRDLKPGNILLEHHGAGTAQLEDSIPKLADFGLAKLLEGDSHQTSTGAIIGTPSYMAPEQAAGQRERIGPRSDVYSLGAILYELLTDRPPFLAASPLDTLVQVLESEPERPRQLNFRIPPALELICLKCLEKAPEQRYASAAALAEDLEHFLSREPVEAQPPTQWRRLRRWASREPALAARLGALAVLAAIIQVRFMLVDNLPVALHWEVQGSIAGWALASWLFQLCLRQDRGAEAARYAWSATDVALLTFLLILTSYQQGPMLVGYPVLVACSGLWFRVRLVWFTTAASLAAYGVILAFPNANSKVEWQPHEHVVFLVALIVIGFGVASQVKRVRALSRFYQQRVLP